jgi:hypothetical protein
VWLDDSGNYGVDCGGQEVRMIGRAAQHWLTSAAAERQVLEQRACERLRSPRLTAAFS